MKKLHENFIKYYRNQKGWSQEQLAEITGQTHATVQRHESGKREPDWETVRKYADALGVHPIDIMEGPTNLAAKDQVERDLLNSFRELEDSAKSMYLHTLKSFGAETRVSTPVPSPAQADDSAKKKTKTKAN